MARLGWMVVLFALVVVEASAQGGLDTAARVTTEQMAGAAIRVWPAGVVGATANPGERSYGAGVVLDGMAAEWRQTANGAEFAYIKSAVDRYVASDGSLRVPVQGSQFPTGQRQMLEIGLGRSVLLLYRVTQEKRYAVAAKSLHDVLVNQPGNAAGRYGHTGASPDQMGMDGAYMAEPFRAEYARTFQLPEEFDDIASQFVQMDRRAKGPGKELEISAQDMGWYSMALVDVLDTFPLNHPKRAELLRIVQERLEGITKFQDIQSGLWWQVMSRGPEYKDSGTKGGKSQHTVVHPASPGNFLDTDATAMLVYSLAKATRKGYIPELNSMSVEAGWKGLEGTFARTANGLPSFSGTGKAAKLVSTPNQPGPLKIMPVSEPLNDATGVGTFLLAGSEMQQSTTQAIGQRRRRSRSDAIVRETKTRPSIEPGMTVLVDAWFNSQTRTNAFGGTELFHYKWSDDANSGFSFFGRAFKGYGARLRELAVAPTFSDAQTARGRTSRKTKSSLPNLPTNLRNQTVSLDGASVYVIASPDIPVKNPQPHYMDKVSADAIEAWVRAGGVLLLMENDKTNSEFEHFNSLSERFGIHFNPVLRNAVDGTRWEMGRLDVPANEVFAHSHRVFMKEISTIAVSGTAQALYTDKGDVLMAVSHLGKGVVFACTDPWLYNEYTDGRKLPPEYDSFAAAKDLAGWAMREADKH